MPQAVSGTIAVSDDGILLFNVNKAFYTIVDPSGGRVGMISCLAR